MKRRIMLILLLLIAGAIVNVAVAWGCVRLQFDAGVSYVRFDPPIYQTQMASSLVIKKAGWPLRAVHAHGNALRASAIWPGFAINTVFYATILWGLFAAPFALRRRLRVKRGLCPKCAYPVGTSDVCTECGAAAGGPIDGAQ
jgi:hypothetical protein